MRNHYILVIVFILSIITFGQIPTNNLVAYYPFNGNPNDLSGNNNNGVIVGGVTLTTDRFGNPNSAYYFDGVDGYIDCGIASNVDPLLNSFSISAWVYAEYKPNDPRNILTIVGKQDGDSDYSGFALFFNQAENDLILHINDEGNWSRYNNVRDSISININNPQWYHIVGVANQVTKKLILYVDGVLTASDDITIPNPIRASSGHLLLGAYMFGTILLDEFKGKLDDIRIYHKALTSSEILELYQEDGWNNTQGLIAHYPFNGNANDASGNNNNGTAHNGVAWVTDRFGNPNSAASFDGINDYIIVNNSATFPNNAITIAYWVNRQSINPTTLENYISKELAFQSYLYNTDKKFWSGVWLGSPGNWMVFSSGNYVIPINDEWVFYAFTYDNTNKTARTYINGSIVNTETTTNPNAIIRTSSHPMYIGRNGSASVYYIKGYLDDMRIYNRVLTGNEVLELYDEGGFTPPIFNISLTAPNSTSWINWFPDDIVLEQDKFILSTYLYLDLPPANPYTNIKVTAYLDGEQINIQLNTANRLLDGNNDGKIDQIPLPNTNELGVRFLIYTNDLQNNINGANLEIVIEEIDGIPTNIIFEEIVNYHFTKTIQEDRSFYLKNDAYSFRNLSKLSWAEFRSILFQWGYPNLLGVLFTQISTWNGRCWGMSATSGKYFLNPNSKPHPTTPVFSWDESDVEVTNSISIAHLNQMIYIFNAIFPPSNESSYQKLQNYLSQQKPVLLSLWEQGKTGGHAVLATSMTTIDNYVAIRVYDSNYPYQANGAGDYCFTFNTVTNELNTNLLSYNYDRFDAFTDLVFNVNTNFVSFELLAEKLYDYLQTNLLKQIWVGCPVNIMIKNDQGLRYGFDSQGNFYDEIFGCSFIKVPSDTVSSDSITVINAPMGENYFVEINAYENGTMLFSTNETINSTINSYYADSVEITATTIIHFNENYPENGLLIDYDGDGQIDTTISVINIITSEEGWRKNPNAIPTDYALSQNYPNPFNPVTKISYALPSASMVDLKVYNVLGQLITTLVNEENQSGFYKVDFNAADLPSGVYFYRLQASDFIQTRKMLLLK